MERKDQDANPQANPSSNDPSAEDKTENAEMDKGTDDNVETNTEQQKDEDAAPFVSTENLILNCCYNCRRNTFCLPYNYFTLQLVNSNII